MDQLTNNKIDETDFFPDVIERKTSEELIQKKENIAEPIQSPNYRKDSTGWRLNSNGIVEFNNIRGVLTGTKIYYVSDSSGGVVDRKLTFLNGLLISET